MSSTVCQIWEKAEEFFQCLTIYSGCVTIKPSFERIDLESFQSNYSGPLRQGVKAIRTAGSTAGRQSLHCLIDWVKSSNFISWLLHNRNAHTCKLVKRSIRVVKVELLYRLWSSRRIWNSVPVPGFWAYIMLQCLFWHCGLVVVTECSLSSDPYASCAVCTACVFLFPVTRGRGKRIEYKSYPFGSKPGSHFWSTGDVPENAGSTLWCAGSQARQR